VTQGLPERNKVTGWWRLAALAQWLLMALMLAGLAWIALILAFHGGRKQSSLVSDLSLVPWLAVMAVALLLLGWLISSWCQNMVVLAADREREHAAQDILSRVAAVASDLVLAPTGRELADYERFRTELAAARRLGTPLPLTRPPPRNTPATRRPLNLTRPPPRHPLPPHPPAAPAPVTPSPARRCVQRAPVRRLGLSASPIGPASPSRTRSAHQYDTTVNYRGTFERWGGKWGL
jgi:hypothetical protein